MVSNPFSDGITVEIGADASGLSSAIANAQSSLQGFEGQVAAVGTALAALSAGGLAASISAAADFEQTMSESLAVVGDISADTEEQMESTARTVAQDTRYSAQEAAEGYYFLASAGLEAEEQMAALPDVANFAAAGNIELAQASDYATDIMQAFGYEADELDGVMDTLTATFTNHNQTAEGVGEAMAYVAPVANAMGLEIEEASAAIGMMGDAGIKGSRAGTALRQSLSNLASPSENQAKVLSELGVEVENTDGEMRDFTEIIRDLEEAGISSGQVMELFGTRAGPAMQVLLDQGADALEDHTGAIEESGGITEQVAEDQMDNFNSQVMILWNNLEELAIQIGQALLPALTGLVEMLSSGVIWLQDINEATDGWAGALTLIVGLITGVTTAGAALVSMFGGLAAIKAALIGTTSALVSVLATVTAPVLAIVAAVGLLYAAWTTNFAGIQDHTMRVVETLQEALQPAIDWLSSEGSGHFETIQQAVLNFVELSEPYVERFVELVADGLVEGIEIAAEAIGIAFDVITEAINFAWNDVIQPFLEWAAEQWEQSLAEPVDEAAEVVGMALEWLGNEFTEFWEVIVQPVLEAFREGIQRDLEAIAELWENHGETVMDVVTFLFDNIKVLVEGFIATVGELFSAFFSLIQQDWDGVTESLLSIWERFTEGIVTAAEWLYDMLVGSSIFPDMFDAITDLVTNWAEAFETLIVGTLEAVYDLFATHLENVLTFVTETFDNIRTLVEDQFGAVQEFITDTLGVIADTFTEQLQLVLDLVQDVWNSINDDTVSTWEVILQFISDTLDNIFGAVEDILTNVQNYFEDTFDNVRTFTEDQFQAILDFITDTLDNILSTAEDILQSVYDAFETAFSDTLQAAEQFASDVLTAIEDLLQSLLDAITSTDVRGAFEEVVSAALEYVQGMASEFLQAGKDLVGAIVDGIKSSPGAVKDAVGDVVGDARDMLPFSDAKEGPLSDLTDSGEAIPETLASGAESEMGELQDVLSSLEPPSGGGGAASGAAGGGPTNIEVEINAPGGDPGAVESAVDRGLSNALDAANVTR